MTEDRIANFTRGDLIEALNHDLSREYQAIIAYVNYSQVLTGAAYMSIAATLEVHAHEGLDHALKIAKAIDYLGGMPAVTPRPVKTSTKAEDRLRFDLENESETISHYRRRVNKRRCWTSSRLRRQLGAFLWMSRITSSLWRRPWVLIRPALESPVSHMRS